VRKPGLKLCSFKRNLYRYITVLLCLIFWGMLWGIPGMVLAAPITAVGAVTAVERSVCKPFCV
jgi:hypothetical protein